MYALAERADRTWYPGAKPTMDLKYPKTVGQTHQDRRPSCPGRMDICLVSEEVAPFGRPFERLAACLTPLLAVTAIPIWS